MTQSRSRARIGVLVPFTNTNLEPDLWLMAPPGVSFYVARLGGYDADEIPDDARMQGLGGSDLTEPLELLGGVFPDVILYGCTSATLTHGTAFDRDLAETIRARTQAASVTAAGVLSHALTTLGVSRIGFASPYVAAINDKAVGFLADEGFETVQRSEMAETLDNTGQGALTPDRVQALGLGADHAGAEAIVLSCTDMRSVETAAALEQATGKPVITSNQAMLYQALQLAQIPDPLSGFGQLLERPRL